MKSKYKNLFTVCFALLLAFISALALCVQALNTPVPVAATGVKLSIVIDAGHGGIDGGVVGKNGAKESDLNLKISFKLKEILEELGFEVTLTRKTTAGLYGLATKGFKKRDMQKRKEIIQEASPDLVLSIHQNFYSSNAARGGQVFYDKQSEQSWLLASCLQTRLNELYERENVKARKEKSGEYYILRCTDYPTVIIECGFLSNAKDEALLKSNDFIRKLCSGITSGVLTYLQTKGTAGFA